MTESPERVTILAIDPGRTSGFVKAVTSPKPGALPVPLAWGTWVGIGGLLDGLPTFDTLDVIVVEDYRVYSHKARQHVGSRLLTARMIGAIELIALEAATMFDVGTKAIPIHLQSASQAKNQWPDSRLRLHYHRRQLRQLGAKHVLDALRHLLTYVENKTPTGTIISPTQEAI